MSIKHSTNKSKSVKNKNSNGVKVAKVAKVAVPVAAVGGAGIVYANRDKLFNRENHDASAKANSEQTDSFDFDNKGKKKNKKNQLDNILAAGTDRGSDKTLNDILNDGSDSGNKTVEDVLGGKKGASHESESQLEADEILDKLNNSTSKGTGNSGSGDLQRLSSNNTREGDKSTASASVVKPIENAPAGKVGDSESASNSKQTGTESGSSEHNVVTPGSNETNNHSNNTGDSGQSGNQGGSTGDNTGDSGQSGNQGGSTGDNTGDGSPSGNQGGSTDGNTGDGGQSGNQGGSTGDNTGDGSPSGNQGGSTGDNTGDSSPSGNQGGSTGGNTGDGGQSGNQGGSTGDNTGDGGQSGNQGGSTGDNTGDGSPSGNQGGSTGDNTGDGSQGNQGGSTTDGNTGDSGQSGNQGGSTGDNTGDGSQANQGGSTTDGNTGDGGQSGNQGGSTSETTQKNVVSSSVTVTKLIPITDENGNTVYTRQEISEASHAGIQSGNEDLSFQYETSDGQQPNADESGNLPLPDKFAIKGAHGYTLKQPDSYQNGESNEKVGNSTLHYYVGDNENDELNQQMDKTVTISYKQKPQANA